MLIDYEILRVIWWGLIVILLTGFAIMDGFDFGVAMWLPWLSNTDTERRIMINSIGPTWEGNQVWFVLGGGAIFAAWPMLYAVSFSGFYLAMLVILLALILRPVGFKYRSKLDNPLWRKSWDWALFIGGFVPALIFGVAMGNVLQGVPFHFDDNLRSFYTGTFWALLNPFALLAGVLSVVMLAMHGGRFLGTKTEGAIEQRAVKAANGCAVLTMVLFVLAGVWVMKGIEGYQLVKPMQHSGPSNPLHKLVELHQGAWLLNYKAMPWTMLFPALGVLGALLGLLLSRCRRVAFVCSSLSILGIISTVAASMFPFILPSSSHPNHSLMVWDSSSSQSTLFLMLIVAVVFMPLILMYTAWVYRVLRGKVTEEDIKKSDVAY